MKNREREQRKKKLHSDKSSTPGNRRISIIDAVKAKAILLALSVAGLTFVVVTVHAVIIGDKDMITQCWNAAQSVLTGILIWALGQNRTPPNEPKAANA